MSQRRRIRQQVVGDADPLLDCAGGRTEDELPAESENAACSAGATLKEGVAVRGTRLEDSHRHSWHARAVSSLLAKGKIDSGGHESVREPMEKMPHRGSVQDRPRCAAPG
jgi:hypothetical protein